MNPSLPAPMEQINQASIDDDMDSFLAAWTPDALLSDSHRKYWGREAIRRWSSIEWLGDRVTVTEVRNVRSSGDEVLTQIVLEGDYDKQGLPEDYLCTFLLKIRADQIARMIITPVNGRRLGKMTQTRLASTCFSAPMPSVPPGAPGARWASPSAEALTCAKPIGSRDQLPPTTTALLSAIQDKDLGAFTSLFEDSALLSDKHRLIEGRQAIARWAEAEVFGPGVTIEALDAVEHYGDCVLTTAIGGGIDRGLYDKFVANSSMATWRGSQPDALHAIYVTPEGSHIKQLVITPIDGSSPITTDPEPMFVPAAPGTSD